MQHLQPLHRRHPYLRPLCLQPLTQSSQQRNLQNQNLPCWHPAGHHLSLRNGLPGQHSSAALYWSPDWLLYWLMYWPMMRHRRAALHQQHYSYPGSGALASALVQHSQQCCSRQPDHRYFQSCQFPVTRPDRCRTCRLWILHKLQFAIRALVVRLAAFFRIHLLSHGPLQLAALDDRDLPVSQSPVHRDKFFPVHSCAQLHTSTSC